MQSSCLILTHFVLFTDCTGFFFVDTMAPNGPRSIWTHPLDDPEFLSTVPQGMDPLAYVYKLWADAVC